MPLVTTLSTAPNTLPKSSENLQRWTAVLEAVMCMMAVPEEMSLKPHHITRSGGSGRVRFFYIFVFFLVLLIFTDISSFFLRLSRQIESTAGNPRIGPASSNLILETACAEDYTWPFVRPGWAEKIPTIKIRPKPGPTKYP
jgi:hypothetical protein